MEEVHRGLTKEVRLLRPALIRALLPAGAATVIPLRREAVRRTVVPRPIPLPAEVAPHPALSEAVVEAVAADVVLPAVVAAGVPVAAADNRMKRKLNAESL